MPPFGEQHRPSPRRAQGHFRYFNFNPNSQEGVCWRGGKEHCRIKQPCATFLVRGTGRTSTPGPTHAHVRGRSQAEASLLCGWPQRIISSACTCAPRPKATSWDPGTTTRLRVQQHDVTCQPGDSSARREERGTQCSPAVGGSLLNYPLLTTGAGSGCS